jgi:hypothetical protein
MTDNSAPHLIPDELLMRFVDGDLSPEEQSTIGAEATRDPDVAARIEAFRFTREEFARAFAPALEVPLSLAGKLRAAGLTPTPSAARPRLVGRAAVQRSSLRRPFMAMAASVALLLAGAAGWLLHDSLNRDYVGLIAPPSLQRALDKTRSGNSTMLAANVSMKVHATFASLQDEFCREYTLIFASGAEAAGLACRGADGSWRVDVQEGPAKPSQKPTDPTKYETVGQGGAQDRGPVADHRNSILRVDLLPQDEEDLIRGHWKRKP